MMIVIEFLLSMALWVCVFAFFCRYIVRALRHTNQQQNSLLLGKDEETSNPNFPGEPEGIVDIIEGQNLRLAETQELDVSEVRKAMCLGVCASRKNMPTG